MGDFTVTTRNSIYYLRKTTIRRITMDGVETLRLIYTEGVTLGDKWHFDAVNHLGKTESISTSPVLSIDEN